MISVWGTHFLGEHIATTVTPGKQGEGELQETWQLLARAVQCLDEISGRRNLGISGQATPTASGLGVQSRPYPYHPSSDVISTSAG